MCVCASYLTVESQKDNHDEEQRGPERRERHHAHSSRVSDEGETRAWRDQSHGRNHE